MLVPRLPWERHPRRSLSVVARVWGSHAGAWEPSIIRTMPIVPMLPRGNVARVAPCRWLRSAWGLPRRSVGAIKHPHHADHSHAPAWERCPRRSLSMVARCLGLPRRSVGAINHPYRADRSHAPAWERHSRAPCRWLRSAWDSHAGAWEPSIIRTVPIVPMLPRGNVARVAPCRWLRSAWDSRATGRNAPDRPERTFRVRLRS